MSNKIEIFSKSSCVKTHFFASFVCDRIVLYEGEYRKKLIF